MIVLTIKKLLRNASDNALDPASSGAKAIGASWREPRA